MSIKDRVSENLRYISPYSVPRFDCPVRLDGNESPYDLPSENKTALCKRLAEISVNRYPDFSVDRVIQSLSRLTGVPSDGILLGNGSDEIIQMIIEAFSGTSDCVLVPSPTFSMYRITSLVLGKQVVEIPLDKDFDIDLDSTLDALRDKNSDIVFLSTPNNPTGNSFSEEKLLSVVQQCPGVVVIDEAYCDFSKKSYIPFINRYENLLVLRTMSKIGFAAARLGMLFARPEIVSEVNKARLPYNINSFSQEIMAFALEHTEIIERGVCLILKERDRLCGELKKLGSLDVYPTDANFFLVRVRDADSVFLKLVEDGILVRRFEGVDRLSDCLRITVGTREENEKLVSALVSILP